MVEGAGADSDRDCIEKLRGRVVRTIGEADFVCENVGGSGRQGAEDDLRTDDTVENFVDCAVAARGKHYVKTPFDGGAPEFARHVGAGGRHQLDFASRAAEGFDGCVETGAFGAHESARTGIEDDSYTL